MNRKIISWMIIILFITISFPIVSSTMLRESKINNLDGNEIVVTDISFDIFQIVASIKNNGMENKTVSIVFSVICMGLFFATLPYIIGTHDVEITAGETVTVSNGFCGIGFYRFIVLGERGYDVKLSCVSGFWYYFNGIKIRTIN